MGWLEGRCALAGAAVTGGRWREWPALAGLVGEHCVQGRDAAALHGVAASVRVLVHRRDEDFPEERRDP